MNDKKIDSYYEPSWKTSKIEDDIYATKFYVMQKQIDELQQENKQLKEVIDKAIKNEEEIMYLTNKVAITTQNVEIKAVRDRLEEIFDILKEVE